MRARASYRTVEEGFRNLATIINNILDGKTGTATLLPNETETLAEDSRVGFNSNINLTPTTANAAAAVSTTYLHETGKGYFILRHGNAATENRQFRYTIEG